MDIPALDPTSLDGLDEGPDPFAGEEPTPASRYDGAEASKSVWVTVDRRGRFVDVSVSSTWRQRLAAERFADALFAAYTNAIGRMLVGELMAGRAPARQVERPAPEPDDPERWRAGVRDRLRGIEARLRASAAEWDTALVAPAEFRGPNGYVTLSVRGGEVVGISGNAAGIAAANPNKLREDVLAAFRDANQ